MIEGDNMNVNETKDSTYSKAEVAATVPGRRCA